MKKFFTYSLSLFLGLGIWNLELGTLNAQTITVSSPNGGETWAGCSSKSITWSHSGTSGFFNVEYSTNNGSTWASLANNYSGSSFTWNPLPNISSSQALVRVYDYSNNTIRDSSNSVFTITPALVVTSPNGGEQWQVANPSTRNITWDGFGTSNSFLLEYSTNGGSSWTSISSTTFTPSGNSYSYTWTIPNNPSAFCLVRVTDNGSSCKSDASNNVFEIVAPTPVITVTSPNGANTLYIGQSFNITWTSAYLSGSFVKIEYSTNNGSTWSNVIASTSNTGSYSWNPIPNNPSSTCLIKISDAGNLLTYDVSDATFTITLGTIAVTYPNGGESLNGCQSYNITWTRAGTSNYFNIDYSTNNGSSWSAIASNYYQSGSNGSFSWTVPNVSTSQARVRVRDYNNTAITDSSDNTFTINPALVLTSPNGSETWQGGTAHLITWTQGPGASNYWTIQYSTDGGNNWTNIVYNTYITSGQYNWNPVVNTPSSNCLIRIYQGTSSADCRYDVSDALFTITPATPVITVTSPNGGNTYYVGGSYNITWTYQYVNGTFVKIEYSTDNGTNWTTITNSTSINTGSYTWNPVPNTPSANCLVKVSEYNNSVVNDSSNAVFSIVYPYVVVTAPNGGQSWNGCTNQNITWNYYGTGSPSWKVEYSTDNGANWSILASSTSGSSYNWASLPNNATYANSLVKVTKTTDALVKDSSDATFTINKVDYIVVTSPNGGESWQVNNPATRQITWTATTTSYYYNLYYSTNGGSSWNTITTAYYNTNPNPTYTWTVPNNPSANCLIRIEDYYNTCKIDYSDAVFEIVAPNPVITVTSPNGGNTYYVGGSYNITWTYQYVAGSFVKIEYSTNNGSSWTTITNSTSISTGSYAWNPVPNTPSNQCLVKVSEYNNSVVNDSSNAVFNIVYPYVVVTAPNGGQSWNGCTSQTISWTPYQYGSSNWKVEYSTDNGANWNILTSSTSSTSYTWNPIPNDSTYTNSLVKVTKTTDALVKDSSDATFTINKVTYVILNSPNGGEQWQVANPSTRNITWSYSGTSNYFNIYYSINGGSSWISIVNSYYAGSSGNGTYSWTIPNNPSANCLVRVEDYYASCKYDQSDAAFEIIAPTPVITVNSPNGGNIYYVGGSYNITWSYQYVNGSFVQIQYSTNNGSTWNNIIGSTSISSGSYTWNPVPNTPSNQCLVRIRSTSDTTVVDSSNSVFNIVYPYVVVNSPNGGQSWNGCTSQTITWTPYQYGSSNWKVEYSTDNGTSWTVLTSSTSSNSFTWNPVPNDSTYTNSLVKVTKTTDALVKDSSDATFTLNRVNYIVVTAPNGGEQWTVGNPATQQITWTASSTSYYYNLYYSTNGGTSWNTITTAYYSTNPNPTYMWTIPNNPSANCIIRIEDYYNTCKYDKSDAVFSILAPTPVITVTSPNGGNTYYVGGSYNITWTYQYVAGSFVKIEYSTNNGSSWNTITNSTSISAGSYTWNPVPNTPSNQCLVKVSEYNNSSVKDSSNAVFNIVYPYVVVTSPNGGQNWNGCTNQTISWTPYQYGSSNWKVEYSLDSGLTWTVLTSSTSSTSYTWNTLPNNTYTNSLVRVTKTTDTLVKDMSDAVFTINKFNYIIVTSPNGGESWQVNNPATQQITWTRSGTSNYYNIWYSTNGGSTWTSIVTAYYSTSANPTYTWTIPNAPSSNCLIQVHDYYNSCMMDTSDATFTIVAPTPVITVTSPNGGNTFYVGTAYNITWTWQYLSSSFVKIEYSTDNGGSWSTIANAANNNGTYSWTTPNTPSTQCLVKVSEYGNPTVYDESNTTFSIVTPYITVNSPNGGENWNGCTAQTISWSGYGLSGPYMVEYSTDNGTSWTTLVSSTGSSSYSWNPIPNQSSTQTLIRVSLVSNSGVNDVSNSTLNINQVTYIIVNSPNGGESWQVNNPSTQTINWAYSGTNNYFNLYYSINGGTSWITIVNSYYAGTSGNGNYTWTIPNNPSNNVLVRVEDYVNSCKYDQSDAPFTIVAPTPYITVTSPNGGNTYYSLNSYNITWTSGYLASSFVKIEYSVDSGATWIVMISSTNNSGSYSWSVPTGINSTKCLVRVTDYGNNATYDVSDAVFTIKPAVTVNAPNGGEDLSGCTVTTITWQGESGTNSYNLQYSINGGSSWTSIVSQSFSGGPNYSYNWTLPNSPSDFCLVKIINNSNTSKVDQSDSVFSILPTITVTNPNNGGSYAVGSTLTITWTSQGVSDYYDIEYTTNGGTNWNTIVFNQYITTNTYDWTVPNAPSTNCYIRVKENGSFCKMDQGNVAFTISASPASITVTSPNGAETWQVCSLHDITWSANGTSGNYDIEYSSNNGSSWASVVTNYASTNGVYSWTLPSTATTQGLVRVKDSGNGSLIDQSNAVFTISNLGTPAAISGNTPVCEGSSQTYSVALVTGATSYTWTLPSGWTGTSTSNTINVIVGNTTGNVSVTANNSCSSSAASTKSVTVTPLPATPGAISGNTTPCTGVSVNYSISAVSGATSYSWLLPSGYSGSSTTTSINVIIGSSAGDIEVAANNSCGSGGYATLTITPNGSGLPEKPGNISGPTAPCASSANNTYSIVPVAGATTYTWTLPSGWTGSSTTNSNSATAGTSGGNITVTANNSCGSSTAQTLAVSISNVPAQPGTISGTSPVCQNSTNTYSISAVSGATSYTWTLPSGWTGSSSSTSISAVASGSTGNVQVVANNSCGSSTVRTLSVTVNTPSTPSVTASVTPNGTICANQSLSFSASPTNGGGSPSYQWIKNGVAVGTNSAIYNQTGGWNDNDSVWVILNSSLTCVTANTAISNKIVLDVIPNVTPTISISSSATSVCAGTTINFTSSITNGGSTPTYQWRKNGVNISGATSSTYSTSSIVNNDQFTCVVTSNAQCASPSTGTSNAITITITNNVAASVNISANPSGAICAGTAVTFSSSIFNGGTPTYQWTINGVNVVGANSSTYVEPGLSNNDTVRCVMTSSLTCITNSPATSNAIIKTVNPLPPTPTISASGATTFCSGDSVILTSSSATGSLWSNSATTQSINVTTSGNFSVTVTDGNGCTAASTTTSVTVNPSPTVSITKNDVLCSGDANGDATANPSGGLAPYSYLWSNTETTQNIGSLTAGNYSVTVTDGNTCTSSVSTVINAATTVVVADSMEYCKTQTPMAVLLGSPSAGVWTGSAGVTIYGNDTLDVVNTPWTLGAPHTLTYTVNGCSDNVVLTITGAKAGNDTAVCVNDGIFNLQTASPSGGTWSSIGSGGLIDVSTGEIDPTGLSGNVKYIYTHTGCPDTMIVSYREVSLAASSTNESCSPATDGMVGVNASGGNTPYSYNWSNGGSSASLTNLNAGSFDVTVSDNDGCAETESITITKDAGPNITVSQDSVSICEGDSVNISASGATSFNWTPSSGLSDVNIANPNASPNSSVTYYVTGTTSGCTDVDSVFVTVNSLPATPTISLSGSSNLCPNDTVTLTSSNATGNSWLPNNETTQSIDVSSAGTFSVTVTDGNNCSASSSATAITSSPIPSITASGATSFCIGDSVTLTSSSSTGNVWSPNNETTQSIVVNSSGNYSVSVNDGSCVISSNTISVTVNSLPTPTISANGATTFCAGDSVTLTSSAGTGNVWSPNNETTQSIVVTSSGNYSVTETDVNGCVGNSASTSVTVNSLPSTPIISASGATSFCIGDSVILTSNSSTGNSWLPNGETTQSIVVNSSGNYSVVVTDGNGCSATSATTNITVNSIPSTPTISASGATTFCSGDNVTLTSSAENSYFWSSGETTQSINVTSAGNYSVTVTNAGGCTAASSATSVTVNSAPATPTISASGATSFCVGDSVILTSSSATDNVWSPNGETTQSITISTSGSYSVMVMDGNGCTASSATTNVTVSNIPSTPAISPSGATTFCSGGSVTLTSSAENSYLWSNGLTTQSVNVTSAGNYSVTVTNAGGCSAASSSTSVTVNPSPNANAGPDVAISQGGSTQLNASGGGTYSWSPSASLDNANISNPTATPANTTTYTVTVTDGNGCTATDAVVVTVNVILNYCVPTYTNLCSSDDYIDDFTFNTLSNLNSLCNGNANNYIYDTVLTTTVTKGNTYNISMQAGSAWSQGFGVWIDYNQDGDFDDAGEFVYASPSAGTGIYSGTVTIPTSALNGVTRLRVRCQYNSTVTSTQSCTNMAYGETEDYNITIVPNCGGFTLNTSSTDATCGNNNGTATASISGGSTPYSYNWSNGANNATATGLSAGNYSVTVTDNNGCTANNSVSVSGTTAPTVSASSTDINCNGGNDGTVTANASSGTTPYSYLWGNGASASSLSGLSAGNYSVTVTDANNCTATASATVSEPALLNTGMMQTNVSCNGGNNGDAMAMPSGGTSPYSFLWNDGQTGQTATDLIAGNYSVTVTDASGCTATGNATVTEPPTALSSSTTSTDATCNGSSDGTANIIANGGTSPYSYLWSNNATTSQISNLTSQIYFVTVTDNNSCTSTSSVTVSEPIGISLNTSATPANCNASDGSATVNASGGAGGFSYLWSDGQTTTTATGLAKGNYSVTITDANSCSNDTSVFVGEVGGLSAGISSSTNVNCFAGNDGSAVASGNAGTPPYSFLWNDGSSTANDTVSSLAAGNYSVTITDNMGCTDITTVTISEPASAVSVNISASTNVSCFNGNDGSATADANGGTSGYTYSWSNGASGSTASNLIAGSYNVTSTDANGCTATSSVTISQAASAVSVNISSSTNVSCFNGNDGSATADASGGTSGYSYNWSNGASGATASNLIAGSYTVTSTDANGCTASSSVTISQPASAVSVNISSSTNISCFNGNNGSATANANGGTSGYSYNWSNGANGATASNLIAGSYTVTSTDANGCTATSSVTISQPNALSATASSTGVSCLGNSNGTATVTANGGTTNYSYSWNNGGTTSTISNLASSFYNVTVTDANGCTATASTNVSSPSVLNVSATANNVSCFGGNNGSATATANGGTSGYTYSWSNGASGATASNLIAGNYSVTATDANGCTATSSVTITQPSTGVSVSISSSSEVTCNGGNNGSTTALANGGTSGYSYNWSNGATGATASNLIAGTYTVTATDANGCTATSSTAISQPTAITVTTSSTNATCGNINGSTSVTANGGTSPYTYNWSNGSTTPTNNNLAAATYTVTVTDANGCTKTASATVNNSAGPTVSITKTDVSCNGGNNGFATANVSGGTSPFTYFWNTTPSQTTQMATGLSAGNYNVIVTDANSCTGTQSTNVTQPNPLLVNTTKTDNTQTSPCNGTATANVVGGTSPYTYFWSNGEQTQTATGLCANTYTVTVTDANNCTNTQTATVIDIVGINNLAIDNLQLAIFPNPNSGVFNVQCSLLNVQYSIRIYNIIGEVVYSIIPSSNNSIIDLRKFGSGVYTLILISEKGIMSRKLIVE